MLPCTASQRLRARRRRALVGGCPSLGEEPVSQTALVRAAAAAPASVDPIGTFYDVRGRGVTFVPYGQAVLPGSYRVSYVGIRDTEGARQSAERVAAGVKALPKDLNARRQSLLDLEPGTELYNVIVLGRDPQRQQERQQAMRPAEAPLPTNVRATSRNKLIVIGTGALAGVVGVVVWIKRRRTSASTEEKA